ncbi:fumarylacetoacetate (FAA) hydrolase family protein [Pseudarthrobacter siccitolerans]|uniref:Fumarylacetoacetate (FAA) hydrolase family protein n=1 Tax=Pseudarthrobacter siccitolerans TaxID=861266 RepID=A0ABU0PM76_9MICC|nr:fumarylacetoacetate (FAA) hydrolase family protein [Pseudarthrobacter siccitolerans]
MITSGGASPQNRRRGPGGSLDTLRPGSEEAPEVKKVLSAEGMWSQYLEVGLGPDPEVFTKAPALSSVGFGPA